MAVRTSCVLILTLIIIIPVYKFHIYHRSVTRMTVRRLRVHEVTKYQVYQSICHLHYIPIT